MTYISNFEEFINESKDDQMTDMEIREAIAESGQTRVKDIMNYLKRRFQGKYNVKMAKEEAKDMVADMPKS